MAAGTYVHVNGLESVHAVMKTIAKDDLNPAKGDLRAGTFHIANSIIIPALKTGAANSGVGAAPKIADTARARKDRYVTVKVGAVNPKLSGFKRVDGKYKTTLAWGSDRGGNNYGVARSPSWWVVPTMESNGTFDQVRTAYSELLGRILRRYGRGF